MGSAIVKARISLQNILYATDFSRYSHSALPYARSIARKYGSRIVAVHVISLSPFTTSSPTQAWQAMVAQAVRESKEAMKGLEPQWKGIPHETLVRRGNIWTELSTIIGEKDINLIITGTHGRTGISKLLMGSVAETIFRHAPCPVLTIGPDISGEPDSFADIHIILYPTDFRPESLTAASYAISLAQENQARLYLLHVVESAASVEEEASLRNRLRSLVPPEAELSCAPKALVEFGTAAQKILDLAEELAVDLIVLGPKRTPIVPGGTHLGVSTAYKVASQAICPVLTVRR